MRLLCVPETRSDNTDDEVRRGSAEQRAGRAVGSTDGSGNPCTGTGVFGIRCNFLAFPLATKSPFKTRSQILCLRKSRNRRPSVAFLVPCPYRRGHDHPSVRCRFPALVPDTQPHLTGTRARRSATPGDRPASATPWPASALLRRSVALGVALPDLAAGPQHHGVGQTGNRRPVAS
jgi:hypothetical protein